MASEQPKDFEAQIKYEGGSECNICGATAPPDKIIVHFGWCHVTTEIPLAEERGRMAVEMATRVFDAARELLANGTLEAVGYRVLIKPIEGTKQLEQAEAEIAPTLAQAGFETKSNEQKAKEERGENHGIVLHMGPMAFKSPRLGGPEHWCAVGDTVVFSRYAGTRVEHPPGSQTFYQLMNDEDIFGKVV